MREFKIDREKLASLCREYHVKRLAVFGSVLHGKDTPGSDLDLLIEFEGSTPGIRFFNLQDELSYLFGQTVDLNTSGFLSRYFRDSVAREATTIYAA
jgi:predicted nucleotidyltransferase